MFIAMGAAGLYLAGSERSAEAEQVVLALAISGGVVAALSVGLAYALARRTSLSGQAFAEGARRLASGDLEYRVEATAPGEILDLAETFNRMATTIRDMVRDLSAERNRLSVVLDTMADGVIVINPDGGVDLMNRAAEWLLETPPLQPDVTKLTDIVRNFEILELVSDAQADRGIHQVELELADSRRFLSAIATPQSEDRDDGVLLTLRDFTGLRQMETTHSEFVSNVSHELRTPLASVKALVETLQDGALEDTGTARDFLRRIHGDVDRMTAMVSELLELSRLESGHAPIHLAPVDVRSVVEETRAEFAVRLESGKLSLKTDLPEGLPYAMVDTDKLSQVLRNLVENAVKFTPEGGSIAISATASGQWLELRVSDTGMGIAPAHLPHVFERFYKVERSRRDDGTGLGLAIVKHLIEAQGGDIRAESVEGQGSTFVLALRRAS
jgi:two-component system phosphate regulon sensor histidine kinase PhoR